MKFRTEIAPVEYPQKISLGDSLLTIGSCFSNTIGDKLSQNKIDCLVNPFGTIYDPLSITRLLTMAIEGKDAGTESMVESNGLWKNLFIHSSFVGLSENELRLQIRAKLDQVKNQLLGAQWLVITLGTSFAYKYLKTNQFIANCQKLPAKAFSKELLSQSTLLNDFQNFHQKLIEFNPNINILITVSPVRHIRDGLTENGVSKSILRILANTLSQEHETIFYYPSYEIVQDDLRDYRFYKDDLIHPNSQATEYIWNHFTTSLFDDPLISFTQKWKKIYSALKHRPFNPGSYEHQQFLRNLLKELEQLGSKVNLADEIASVKDQILDEQ